MRTQYQTYQQLAYLMKKKFPPLKRNVKFDNINLTLTMDVKVSSEEDWKAIKFEDAKETLKTVRPRTGSFTRRELAGFVRSAAAAGAGDGAATAKGDDSSQYSDCNDDDAVMIVEDSEAENTIQKPVCRLALLLLIPTPDH